MGASPASMERPAAHSKSASRTGETILGRNISRTLIVPAARGKSKQRHSHVLDFVDNPCQAIHMRVIIFALLLWFQNSAQAGPDTDLPRIVSLNLCADPYLMEFAAPEQIIALTWNSHDPTQSPFASRAANFPVTSGRLEEIVEMAPDLVILSPFSMSNRRQTLHRLGIATLTLNAANDYETAREEIIALGQAIQREAQARNYLLNLDARMARLDRKGISAGLLNIQRRGLTTGAGHILDDIIHRAGAQNLGRIAGDGMVVVSLEHVLMLQPDYLLMIGSPPEAIDRGTEVFAHPVLQENFPPDRRITLPASMVLCAGASTPLAVAALQDALENQRPESPK